MLVLHCCEKTVEISCPNKILQKVVEFRSRLWVFLYLFFQLWENMINLCSRTSLKDCLVELKWFSDTYRLSYICVGFLVNASIVWLNVPCGLGNGKLMQRIFGGKVQSMLWSWHYLWAQQLVAVVQKQKEKHVLVLLPLLQRRSEPKAEGPREPLFPASRGRVPGRPSFGENGQQA